MWPRRSWTLGKGLVEVVGGGVDEAVGKLSSSDYQKIILIGRYGHEFSLRGRMGQCHCNLPRAHGLAPRHIT